MQVSEKRPTAKIARKSLLSLKGRLFAEGGFAASAEAPAVADADNPMSMFDF